MNRKSAQSALLSERFGDYDQAPITSKDFLVHSHKGINYYIIDLKLIDWRRIGNIIDECGEVEDACWKAQENFFDYLRKCDVLSYAEKDGRIVAFDAVTLVYSGNTCLYSNDETMVLKEFRGQDIARKLVIVTIEWFLTKTACLKGTRYIVFSSFSANPRVVNSYFKNAWTRIFFDCSFKPSLQLISIKSEYCRKHKIDLVNEDYPFCLKNLFPGSNRFDPNDPKLQFTQNVKNHLPAEFDHMGRGDAFAFLLKIPARSFRFVVFLIMARCFGRDYFTAKGMGFFSPRKQSFPAHVREWREKPVEEAIPIIMDAQQGKTHPETNEQKRPTVKASRSARSIMEDSAQ